MIDINELRRLVQAATPGAWEVAYMDQNGQAVIKGEHIEIATCWHHCVGAIEKEMHANAALIAAANPSAISELLDRLEAAESAWKEADKSCHDLTEKVIPNIREQLESAERERDALHAKVERMEKQEPAMWANSSNIVSARISRERGAVGDQHSCSETKTAYHDAPLYALPGAQNVPKEAIAKILAEVMDIAVSNGANSRSMPDEYVEVAKWLCGIHAQPAQRQQSSAKGE